MQQWRRTEGRNQQQASKQGSKQGSKGASKQGSGGGGDNGSQRALAEDVVSCWRANGYGAARAALNRNSVAFFDRIVP